MIRYFLYGQMVRSLTAHKVSDKGVSYVVAFHPVYQPNGKWNRRKRQAWDTASTGSYRTIYSTFYRRCNPSINNHILLAKPVELTERVKGTSNSNTHTHTQRRGKGSDYINVGCFYIFYNVYLKSVFWGFVVTYTEWLYSAQREGNKLSVGFGQVSLKRWHV